MARLVADILQHSFIHIVSHKCERFRRWWSRDLFDKLVPEVILESRFVDKDVVWAHVKYTVVVFIWTHEDLRWLV